MLVLCKRGTADSGFIFADRAVVALPYSWVHAAALDIYKKGLSLNIITTVYSTIRINDLSVVSDAIFAEEGIRLLKSNSAESGMYWV